MTRTRIDPKAKRDPRDRPLHLVMGVPERPTPAQIKKVRELVGMSQRDFGKMLHASATIVSQWERGVRNMRRDTWELCCIRTGVDKMPHLFTDDDNTEEAK